MRKCKLRERLVRLRRGRRAGEAGFTLVEMLVAMILFLTIAAALAATLTSAVAAHSIARGRTIAEQLARDQVESIRRLPYGSVGTTNGNPPGVVVPSRTVNGAGLNAIVKTRITFVSDAIPGAYVTAANYKTIVVSILRASDSREITKSITYITPPSRAAYGGINNAIVNAQVVDYALAAGVPDATVDLATGPGAPRTDTTDTDGKVTFAALTPNDPASATQAYYDLTATAPGYVTLSDDAPPAGAAHVQLAPGQTFTTALRVYKPATINVVVNDSTNNLYAGTATVTVGSSRATQTFTVTGGRLTVTTLGGEPIVPSLQYTVSASASGGAFAPAITRTVPNSYPTDLTSTFTLRLSTYSKGVLKVTVLPASDDSVIAGALVIVSGGPGPFFLAGITDSSGVVSFTVPVGSGYTVAAYAAGGSGQATATVTKNKTTAVNVYVASGG